MEALAPLLIQLLSGAIGGNAAARILPKFDLEMLWNSVVGIVGGGVGAKLITMALPALMVGGLSVQGILSSILAGAVGGGILLVLVGVVRGMMSK